MASGHKSGTSIGRLKCSLGIVGCFFFFFSSCHVYYKRAGRSKIIAMSPTMAQPMLPVVAAYGGFFHCHGPSSQLACLLRATQEQLSLPTFTWWLIQEGEKVSKILFTFFFHVCTWKSQLPQHTDRQIWNFLWKFQARFHSNFLTSIRTLTFYSCFR